MSRNQKHAVELAGGICRGEVEPSLLSDADWSLLLLAAGFNNPCAGPLAVARGVISRFTQKVGYFAGRSERGVTTPGCDVDSAAAPNLRAPMNTLPSKSHGPSNVTGASVALRHCVILDT